MDKLHFVKDFTPMIQVLATLIAPLLAVIISANRIQRRLSINSRIKSFEADYLKIIAKISNHMEKAYLLNINTTSTKRYLETKLIFYKKDYNKEKLAFETKRVLNDFFRYREDLSFEISMLRDCLIELSHLVVQEYNFFKDKNSDQEVFLKWSSGTFDEVKSTLKVVKQFNMNFCFEGIETFFTGLEGFSFEKVDELKLISNDNDYNEMDLKKLYGDVDGHWISTTKYDVILSKIFPDEGSSIKYNPIFDQLEAKIEMIVDEKISSVFAVKKASGE